VEYLRSIGQRAGASADRRAELLAAMSAIQGYERTLAERMVAGLNSIPGVRLWGISDPARFDERTPTFAITIEGMTPRQVAQNLAREGIFAWDGDFYAQALIERLGQLETGGLLRLGIVHYTVADEVDRVLDALDRMGHPSRRRSRRSQPAAATPA
jgi:selenocysteine lyase/cysteine desulfurase